MIRIQVGCLSCGQMIDGTFAARTVIGIVQAFDEAHLYEKCREEPRDDGSKQAEPAARAASANGEAAEGDGSGESEGPREAQRPH